MKNLIIPIVFLTMLQVANAQSCIPDFIHLNAVARTAAGTPVVPPQQIDVKVEILEVIPP